MFGAMGEATIDAVHSLIHFNGPGPTSVSSNWLQAQCGITIELGGEIRVLKQ